MGKARGHQGGGGAADGDTEGSPRRWGSHWWGQRGVTKEVGWVSLVTWRFKGGLLAAYNSQRSSYRDGRATLSVTVADNITWGNSCGWWLGRVRLGVRGGGTDTWRGGIALSLRLFKAGPTQSSAGESPVGCLMADSRGASPPLLAGALTSLQMFE